MAKEIIRLNVSEKNLEDLSRVRRSISRELFEILKEILNKNNLIYVIEEENTDFPTIFLKDEYFGGKDVYINIYLDTKISSALYMFNLHCENNYKYTDYVEIIVEEINRLLNEEV